jgi:peptidase E
MTRENGKSNGRLFLVAGGRGRGGTDTVLEFMLERLDCSQPRVAYIGAAHADDPGFFKRMKGMLVAAGAGVVELVPLAGRRSIDASAKRLLEQADLVFVSGGDVEEGMRVLKACGAVRPLKALFKKGKPFMGLSAGSIMLGQTWIRWKDPEDDSTAEPFDCLGLAPFSCDTHDEDSGWEELKMLVSLSPAGARGYGIPSGSGLAVEPDGASVSCGPVPVLYIKTS